MSKTPFMPLWVSDFMGKTSDLDAKETGAYLLILMTLWTRGGSLPDDQKKLQRIARVGRDWPKVWDAISHYFTVENGQISQQRLSEELHKVNTKREVNAHAGARGGRAKALKTKEQALANASVSLKQPEPYPEERDKSLSSARVSEVTEEILRIIPKAKARMAPKKTLPKAVKTILANHPPESLLAAVRACYSHPDSKREDGQYAPAIFKFLTTGMWENWTPQAAAEPVAEIADDQWRRLLKAYHESRTWPSYAGPGPFQPDCRVPPEIMARFRAWVDEQAAKMGEAA